MVRFQRKLIDANIFILNFILLDDDFVQSSKFIFKANINDSILIKLTWIDQQEKIIKFQTCSFKHFELFFRSISAAKIILKVPNSDGGFSSKILLDSIRKFDFDKDRIVVVFDDQNKGKPEFIDLNTFMWFEITKHRSVNVFQESLKSTLTSTGISEITLFECHLKNLSKIYYEEPIFYAPFISYVQSSGFGKTKICLELLKKHPGIYMVFRRELETGIPKMAQWTQDISKFIKYAPKDDPEFGEDLNKAVAEYFRTGRFLLSLLSILEEFVRVFKEFETDFITEELKIFSLSESKENDFIALSEKLKSLSLNDSEVESLLSLKPSDRIQKIKDLIIVSISEQFYETHRTISATEKRKIFNPVVMEDELTFQVLIDKIIKLLSNEIPRITDKKDNFPFLLFLDEFDVFNEMTGKVRLPGLQIVRKALNMLSTTKNSAIMVVAIGTNCDVLDYAISDRDSSLGHSKRVHLLPTFFLSGNWDIFNYEIDYHKIEMSPSVLLNSSYFNVLVSFGRALWSSCKLENVMDVAEAKLKNGDNSCLGSRLVLLLVRANLSVNVHHVLARILVRSYMTILQYVSTDAKNIKISYSSEPVLAMASRNILKEKSDRVKSLQAVKESLELRAIEKDRIFENLFEYLILFAIDDADTSKDPSLDLIHDPDAMPEPIRALCKCDTYLLELKQKDAFSSDTRPRSNYFQTTKSYVGPIKVHMMLRNLLDENEFKCISNSISDNIMEALVNCTHFIHLERLNGSEFGGFSDTGMIISIALLKMGLMRQCGYLMPPNYFGINIIIPILVGGSNSGSKPFYSFIAFQTNTCQKNIHDCAFKMTSMFHVARCPVPEHKFETDCKAKDCKSYSSIEKIKEICENQLTLIFTAQPKYETSLPTRKVKVSLKSRNLTARPKTPVEDVDKIEDDIVRECFLKFAEDCKSFDEISSFTFPTFDADYLEWPFTPDFILTNEASKAVSIHKMVWNFSEKDLKSSIYRNHLDFSAEGERIISKSLKLYKEECEKNEPSDPKFFKMNSTCISISGINHFKNLVGQNGTKLIKEIIKFSPSNFQNIDPLHAPIVQNSLLTGSSCEYPSCNKNLLRDEGLIDVPDPTINYNRTFTNDTLFKSIKSCIIGPIDKTLPELPYDYCDDDDDDSEFESESYEYESESEFEFD